MHRTFKRLGEILLERDLLNREQLAKALERSRQTGKKLGRVLVELKIIDEDALIAALSENLRIPKVDLNPSSVDSSVIHIFPRDFAVKHRAIPLFKVENDLTVAMADPTDLFAIDAIREMTKCRVHSAVAAESQIDEAINRFYSVHDSVREVIKDIDAEHLNRTETEREISSSVNDPAVVRLVNLIIMQAVKQQASDIHIEPTEGSLKIRYRLDGILREVSRPPQSLQGMIAARIKIMSDLNVSEKRLPQDGRFKINVDGKGVDVRVSVLPTIWGEKVVMRILDKGNMKPGLDHIGFSEETLRQWRTFIQRPEGIILITGPTGSGKTSTLYAALSEVSSDEKNIVTVEDPVEYNLSSINQVQVNVVAGLTFASALRAILRQDPNIIMIGEMRDLETAEIGIRAALTGHLVFSTLHTRSAAGAITRLIDMGIEPFLVSSSVIAVLSQRLVRRICAHCKTAATMEEAPAEVREMAARTPGRLYHGTGCAECNNTGYRGRTGIHELLPLSYEIQRMVLQRESSETIHEKARGLGMIDLRADGLLRAFQGVTTLDEVFRVT